MAKIHEKAMLVNVRLSMFIGTKHDKKIENEIEKEYNTNGKAGRYNKWILSRDAIKKIQSIYGEIRIYTYENTLPWCNEGLRILPSKHYFEFIKNINKLRTKAEVEVDNLIDNYPDWIEEAKVRLKGMFNPNDYPTISELRDKFSITVDIYPLPEPTGLHRIYEIDEEEKEKIKEEVERKLQESQDGATKELWKRLYNSVKHMNEILSADKRIFSSVIDNIKELCELLPKLNISEDMDLEAVRMEVMNELTQYSSDVLKGNEDIKTDIQKKTEEIMKKMEKYF